MRVERTSAISSAIPLPAHEAISQRSHSNESSQDQSQASASPALSDIAQQFDLRRMYPAEALQFAECLMQEDLLTPFAYHCLTGVPMNCVTGKGCQPCRDFTENKGPYDYISEFENYVSFATREANDAAAHLLQTVLNLLCSLETLRRNGPLDLSA